MGDSKTGGGKVPAHGQPPPSHVFHTAVFWLRERGFGRPWTPKHVDTRHTVQSVPQLECPSPALQPAQGPSRAAEVPPTAATAAVGSGCLQLYSGLQPTIRTTCIRIEPYRMIRGTVRGCKESICMEIPVLSPMHSHAVEGECGLRRSRCPHSGGDEGLALGAWLLAS